MPIIQSNTTLPFYSLAFWEIEEPEDFFTDRLELSKKEMSEFESIKGAKRRQWLASRYLVHDLCNSSSRECWSKTTSGKPYMEGHHLHFNISHSGRYAAAILDAQSVGIDIQELQSKIMRIQHKFIHPEEHFFKGHPHRFLLTSIIWSLKECVYKAIGKKGVSFKQHMRVAPFTISDNEVEVRTMYKSNTIVFPCYFDFIDNYVWAATKYPS